MAAGICLSRLRKELREIQKKPVENIRAVPVESNILDWHYVLEGSKGSPYEGGFYHGLLRFPSEYPLKPPSIQMYTPNGRFKWSVGTILMGLYSFMHENTPTAGSIDTSASFKRKAASESLEFNCKNKIFSELFPELVQLHHDQQEEKQQKESHKLTQLLESGGGGGAGGGGRVGDGNLITSQSSTHPSALSKNSTSSSSSSSSLISSIFSPKSLSSLSLVLSLLAAIGACIYAILLLAN